MGCDPNYVDASWSFYRYEPSMIAAVIFIIVFVATTAFHILQMIKAKSWYLTPLCIGGLCEIVGYINRAINAREYAGCWTLSPYVVQTILLLVAPALMAASIYMILGRIVLLTDGEVHAIIKRRWLTKTFVLGGSVLSGASDKKNLMNIGQKVIITGLFVQIFFFGMFIIVAGLFHRRMSRTPTAASHKPSIRWQKYLITLYVVSILIWVRSAFRVIEYLEGNAGSIMRHEAYVYIFDATLMFLVMAWMNWFHLSEIGLLLRNEAPITNGFELFAFTRSYLRVKRSPGQHGAVLNSVATFPERVFLFLAFWVPALRSHPQLGPRRK
ncbi:hypothetical protein IFM53868_07726 [Aspergillus udagawae]|uniref:Protein RTM1 n=1 Tax=Aspergillus udagawae TaxID=91492 RepID=A0ABQ1B6R0_9EURO|nr:hypothetical protein IFM53868_07726 [Aspergillus udagawae]GFG16599.1 hypothetical protein IFM5058_08042 [Aspergillus udagawae]